MENNINFSFLKLSDGKVDEGNSKPSLTEIEKDTENTEEGLKFKINNEFFDKKNIKKTEILEDDYSISSTEKKTNSTEENKEIVAAGNVINNVENEKKITNTLNVNIKTNENSKKVARPELNGKTLEKNINKIITLNTNKKILADYTNNKQLDNNILPNENNNINSPKNILINVKKENKEKIKSIFKNYLNFTKTNSKKNNFKLEKIVINNNLKTENIEKTNVLTAKAEPQILDVQSLPNKNNFKVENTSSIKDMLAQTNNNFFEKSEKILNNMFKETGIENFDRLKNILDIRNSDVNERLANIFENNIKNNRNRFEIQLRPENLGKIKVSLEILGENVDININSDNINTVQSLLESNNNLQKMLQSQGMNLNNFNLNGNNSRNKEKNSKTIDKLEENNDSITEKNTKDVSDNKVNSDNLLNIKA